MFSILESARVEARVMREYRGMARAYRRLRRRTLKLRPESSLLPAREALLELIDAPQPGPERRIKIPKKHLKHRPGSARDDPVDQRTWRYRGRWRGSGSADLRALAKLKNDYLEENEFVVLKAEVRSVQVGQNVQAGWFKALGDDEKAAGSAIVLPSLVGREREYLSPQGVDYRGEFRPDWLNS